MWDWIMRWWLDVFMGGVMAVLVFGYRWMRGKIKQTIAENEALKAGIQALLRDRIVQAYNHYKSEGRWPIYAREAVMGMYKQYTALGGNGVITDLIDDLKDLPTEKREENTQDD